VDGRRAIERAAGELRRARQPAVRLQLDRPHDQHVVRLALAIDRGPEVKPERVLHRDLVEVAQRPAQERADDRCTHRRGAWS
jgi:hypothetical protein